MLNIKANIVSGWQSPEHIRHSEFPGLLRPTLALPDSGHCESAKLPTSFFSSGTSLDPDTEEQDLLASRPSLMHYFIS